MRRQDIVTRPDNTKETLRVFRCTRCSNVFNDDDWRLRCNAPKEGRRTKALTEQHPENKYGDLSKTYSESEIERAIRLAKSWNKDTLDQDETENE
jgi:predicted  nucleic acid-binding Zn-ribbon protein